MDKNTLRNISEIASLLDLSADEYDTYGKYMAKLSLTVLNRIDSKKRGKLILVTAMSPTKEGEGKTTTTIGLGQAFSKLGKKVAIAIREPSLGPCFGIKGGATGGGKSKVEPSDNINLLFTGDFPAISAAHNLLSALINNHIYHGNRLRIDPRNVMFPRTMDMNDRSLRDIIVGAGNPDTGVMIRDRFVITPASEIMAITGLATSYKDLKERLSRIMIGLDYDGNPVFSGQLKAEGAMAALLKDALRPNLVQTTEGVPAFIHTGPFGNIAHGTSSIIADRMALGLADYVITEAGFGSDLGGQKFIDMVSVMGDLPVDGIVIVATIRSIKMNGGVPSSSVMDLNALEKGSGNLLKHIEIMRNFGFEPVVAINKFPSDHESEIKRLGEILDSVKVSWALSTVFADGGEGGMELAKKVIHSLEKNYNIRRTYNDENNIRDKILAISQKVYGASSVTFTKKAEKDIRDIEKFGFGKMHVCMAKTQYSITDNPELLGWPENFTITVKSVRISSGAGFVVPLLGDIMTMPGLPKIPASENIDLGEDGEITGLF
jgi:formate--tetrahydrofolate ligase